jgi:hypothetical protein
MSNKKSKPKINTNFRWSKLDFLIIGMMLVVFIVSIFTYQSSEKINDKFNIGKTNIDFIVPRPSNEQVDEIAKLSHIDEITPYYFFNTELNNRNDKEVDTYVIETREDLNYTYLSDQLLLKSTDQYNNPAFIDKYFSEKNNIKLGDELVLSIDGKQFKVKVEGIYNSVSQKIHGEVFILNTNDQKQYFLDYTNNNLEYSGAFIKSNDTSKTLSYLADYKPMADMRTPESFASNDLYEKFLKLFNETDYSSSIFKVNKYLTDTELRYGATLVINQVINIGSLILLSAVIITYLIYKLKDYLKTEIIKDLKKGFMLSEEMLMFRLYYKQLILTCIISFLLFISIDILLFKYIVIMPRLYMYFLITIAIIISILIPYYYLIQRVKEFTPEKLKEILKKND